ncbi:hypothetical protein MRX96_049915 [Rhipicephalus microplus]
MGSVHGPPLVPEQLAILRKPRFHGVFVLAVQLEERLAYDFREGWWALDVLLKSGVYLGAHGHPDCLVLDEDVAPVAVTQCTISLLDQELDRVGVRLFAQQRLNEDERAGLRRGCAPVGRVFRGEAP